MQLPWTTQHHNNLPKKDLDKALNYIEDHWQKLLHENKQDTNTLVGLPNPYMVPSNNKKAYFNFKEQYYWDTFFISLGLVDNKYKPIVEGMLDNLAVLYNRFGMIPNASRMYFTSRSQPPLLTTMVNHYKDKFGATTDWYDAMMAIAEDEYHKVWMGEKHPHWRKIGSLNRFYDINGLHDLAEAESGWDMTPRFARKCLDYYPIDLNSLLFKYEKDFAKFYRDKGDTTKAGAWEHRATNRAKEVDRLLWGYNRRFYFDYNFIEQRRGLTYSLAGFYPMWVKMISEERASELVKQLSKFERQGGLTTTTRSLIDISIFGSVDTQWAYPNGWAPLHWIVIKGLENYGYYSDAERIAKKWLKTNLDWYTKHGEFLEKYNMANPEKEPYKGVYPNQSGFGWTNGVFVDLAKDYA
jgi:alpha,alpha-trehalase